MSDVIEDYVQKVSSRLDAPKTFVEASAYNLVSSLLGRYFRCSFVPGTPNVGFRPNTWFLLSSIPGRTRRSTVLNYSNYVYKEVLKKHIISVTHNADDDLHAQEFVDDTIIEEGSPEGIMDHIDITSKHTRCYSIVSSEFGSVLSNIQNKDYQKGVSTLLSKLYYGESGTVMLSQRGRDRRNPDDRKGKRHIPEGLYVTMFTAMQEPKYYLSPIMVGQGLMRRINLVYVKPIDIENWLPPIDMRQEIYKEFEKDIDKMTELMEDYFERSQAVQSHYKLIDTIFFPVAMKMINDVARKYDEALVNDTSFYNMYMQGQWEQLTKISMLHAIARESFNTTGLLEVNISDVEKANNFLLRTTKYSQEVIDTLGYTEKAEEDVTSIHNRLYNYIAKYPEGIERFQVYRHMKISGSQLSQYINDLILQDKIEHTIKETGGRNGIWYCIKK